MAPRADAQRNLDALLTAAKEEFALHGVAVGVRAIAARAGVGTATLYRHFPLRSDLIAAVMRHEMDECADQAPILAAEHPPGEALELWLQRYTQFVGTKRGLAAALHSGDPAYSSLPDYFSERLEPALRSLLDAAAESGAVRADVEAGDLLGAIANLSTGEDGPRMVGLLLDGLRYRAR